jgi:hypothetical protein
MESGETVGVSRSGSMFDGYYSYSSSQCLASACPHRRSLSEDGADGSGNSEGGDGDYDSNESRLVGGLALGMSDNGGGNLHGPGHGAAVSASHYVDGHQSGMTNPNIDEHSSFNDGFAVYARFFHPKGITVSYSGATIWVGDQGNNRIRNISCSGIGAPTFNPTAEPTLRPSPSAALSPPPTFRPSAMPVYKPTSKPAVSSLKGPTRKKSSDSTSPPASQKGARGASMGEVGNVLYSAASNLSTVELAIVIVLAVISAGLLAAMIYFRKRILQYLLMQSSASDAKQVGTGSHAAVVSSTSAASSATPTPADEFGMEAIFN